MHFLKTNIRARLQLAFFAIIGMAALAGVLSYKLLKQVIAHQQTQAQVDDLAGLLADTRIQEKDFLLWGRKTEAFYTNPTIPELDAYAETREKIATLLKNLNTNPVVQSAGLEQDLRALDQHFHKYHQLFGELITLYKQRGFKDWGLEGEMRAYIHAIEKSRSKDEQWFVLMLRRHEKDFFIRQDLKYREQVNKRSEEFIAYLEQAPLAQTDPAYTSNMIRAVKVYRSHFNKIAGLEEQIGLNHESGLQGKLLEQARLIEENAGNIQLRIGAKSQELEGNAIWVMICSCILLIASGILISLAVARNMAKPLMMLSNVMQQVRNGKEEAIDQLSGIRRQDEIGMLINSFNSMLDDVNTKVAEIQEKNKALEASSAREQERLWLGQGVNRFERILMEKQGEVEHLTDCFLRELVKYVGAVQGAVFVKHEQASESCMRLSSCYALDKKRYQHASFLPGEGIVGAVWQEKEAVFMNDIPEDYSKVRSGLGASKPRSILVVPVLNDDAVEGVLELASLSEFSPLQQELVQQVCKGLATTLATAKMQHHTRQLLEQAQRMAQELRESEEVLRQNMEEMQATQEKMRREHTRTNPLQE
ncbi:GAF domain-containing protein [Cesiribacter sp. SM1]|uniref:GAF domain-containing protein n=1 Tax=Cesiribacter sp. SM1 TaxID=2861196 RepID=UPI001CD6E029|nr:GAF domain-containing protein [Cesiribacter sp. SM1]